MEMIFFLLAGIGILVVLPLSMEVSKAATYAYCNARARAMKAHLISSKRAHEFVDFSISEIMSSLEETKGFEDLPSQIGNEFTVEQFHKAFNARSHELNTRLLKSVPKRDRAFMEQLVRRVDYLNFKVLLRLKASNRSIPELLVPTQEFPKEKFDDFMSASLEEFKVMMRFTFFRKIVDEKFDTTALKEFEMELDRDYFWKLRVFAKKSNNVHCQILAQKLIDIHNITMLTSFQSEDDIVQGGEILKAELWEIKQKGKNDEGLNSKELLIALEREVNRFGENLFLKDPLSINSMLGYYVLKETMIMNLKRLLKLKVAKVSNEEIRKVIV